MSTIGTSIQVTNQDTGLAFSLPFASRVTNTPGFAVGEISVVATEEFVVTEYPTPRNVVLRLLSGDDVQVGVHLGASGGVYPLRLSGVNDSMVLRLDVEGLREVSTITTAADTAGSLLGKYLDLQDRTATARVWFGLADDTAEISQIVVNTAASINGKYFDISDDAVGAVRVWIDVNNTGTPPATPASGRLLEVNVGAAPSIADITNAIQAALDGDAKFTATDDNTNTIVATDVSTGGRINIVEPDAAVYFTVSTTQNGSAAPATPGGGRLIKATITVGAANTSVATALQTAVDADAEFSATVLTNVVTVTDAHTGVRNAANVTAGTTTWADPASSGTGAASPTVYLKSLGTSQVVVAVAPN